MKSQESIGTRFLFGGLSCMVAATITNPVDVTKIRLQLQGELEISEAKKKGLEGSISKIYGKDIKYKGFLRGAWTIFCDEGIRGLYKGLTPSLLREGSYSTIRIGGYDVMKTLLRATDPVHTPLWKKVVSGAVSGAIGSAIANPTDLIKVRMQADINRRYKNTLVAFKEIIQREGFKGLYKGVGPTTCRATLLTATQLPVYDHSKHFLLNHKILIKDNLFTHFISSMIAGFAAALVTSSVDVVKTRIMNQKFGKHGEPLLYKSTLDCIIKTIGTEGVLGLYKGFFPNWMRIGPHTVITFTIYEALRAWAGISAI